MPYSEQEKAAARDALKREAMAAMLTAYSVAARADGLTLDDVANRLGRSASWARDILSDWRMLSRLDDISDFCFACGFVVRLSLENTPEKEVAEYIEEGTDNVD